MIYKWLENIQVMLQWDTLEEYWESGVYQDDKDLGDLELGRLMVENGTKIWRE